MVRGTASLDAAPPGHIETRSPLDLLGEWSECRARRSRWWTAAERSVSPRICASRSRSPNTARVSESSRAARLATHPGPFLGPAISSRRCACAVPPARRRVPC